MEKLFLFQNNLLKNVDSKFKRYLYKDINFENRMIGIKGIRGVGKTTLMLQYLKTQNLDKSLYVTLDHPYFYQHDLLSTAEEWSRLGGNLLIIDEVHKYSNWSQELKNIYDGLPNMKIIFSASSALDIYRGEADLSRRVFTYTLHGMSFREYLEFNEIAQLPVLELDEILKNHMNVARIAIAKLPIPLVHFKNYLKYGYLPFGNRLTNQQLEEEYLIKVFQIIDATLAYDMAFINEYSSVHQTKIKKLLAILADSVPFVPNTSELAAHLELSRNTLLLFFEHLEKAALINKVNKTGKGTSVLQKPDKILLENSNFSFALTQNPAEGTIRETFFLNQIKNKNLKIELAAQGDFFVEDKYTFEVGGKSKKQKQILGIPDSYLVKDNIEIGFANSIPIWLFGLMQ
ncbi:ATP-binding protein [Lacihabitans soyangensis]|uniref:ATP-binding protein n=1 Tax=Lacihabitans soyangensis TaxID=869394 RepID=A0AAE3H1E1_9BACT|nr:AAA family ATPase [Lacihabitans soyangensis]MCP9763123.1 ATP-binding protein [Lacihabitans soyangensis]